MKALQVDLWRMAYRLTLLGSSSSGNCALLETAGTRVLIDAGFSGRQIVQRLGALGLGLKDIEAVFFTHEHADHAAGLRGLSRAPHLKFFANRGTADALQRNLGRPVRWQLFETGQSFRFGELGVQTLPLPHDAYDPVGFVFSCGSEGDLFAPLRRLGWLTDLGSVTPELARACREVDDLVLEANHDPQLLQDDPHRPFSVKRRISGHHGHLSNAAASAFLAQLDAPRLRRLCLAHLSRDCNSPEHVRAALNGHAAHWEVSVADPKSEAPLRWDGPVW